MTELQNNHNSGPRPSIPNLKSNKTLLVIVITILAGVITLAGYMLLNRKETSTTANVGSLNLTLYTEYEDYKLKSENNKATMAFQRPKELLPLDLSESVAGFVRLVHQGSSQSTGGSKITASIDEYGEVVPSKITLNNFGVSLTNSQDSGHAAAIEPIKQYISTEFTGYEVTLATVVALPTPLIKENIWQIEFTAKADGKDDAGEDIKGRIIIVASKNAYHYFIVSAIEPVWQKNQDAWRHITDSLRVEP